MLEDLLSRNEGKTLEFKESTSNLRSILKSVIAFSNTSGGIIVIGIRDKTKDLIGIINPLLEEEKLANTISDSISPLLIPDIEISSFRNREFIIIRVPHIAAGPCYLKQEGPEKGVYVRFGSTNRQADQETLSTLRLIASNKTFDELPSSKGHINENHLYLAFKRINKHPTLKQCQALGVYTDHFGEIKPTLGGMLLFGDDHKEILPDSIVRCACFKGPTKDKIIDSIEIDTPLPFVIDEVIAFIERNTRTESIITDIRRKDVPQYPPLAIREAIINALVHTDYSLKGSNIQIALFSNHIEITNPGGLIFGQTMEKALSGYSRLRNRVIGRVFKELNLIEQWGLGLQKILSICQEMGLRTPTFEEKDNHFRTTIYSQKLEKPIFSQFEKHLINYLHKHGAIQTQQAAELWHLSDRSARTRLGKLIEKGIIVRISTAEKDPKAVFVLNKSFFDA